MLISSIREKRGQGGWAAMADRGARKRPGHAQRASRTQKVIAIILLLSLTLSGLAVYAAAANSRPTPQPTGQGQ